MKSLVCGRPCASAALRIFCFPYAGGDAEAIYRDWPGLFPRVIDVCPVQYPGRLRSRGQSPLESLEVLVGSITADLAPLLDRPFAMFGHSMGALVAFEVARATRRSWGALPVHLFVSGRPGPDFVPAEPSMHLLTDDALLAELRGSGSSRATLFAHEELMRMAIPVLKADLKACETHTVRREPPLGCPITALGGLEDEVGVDHLQSWQEQTNGAFHLHRLPGDHFFIHGSEKLIAAVMTESLLADSGSRATGCWGGRV